MEGDRNRTSAKMNETAINLDQKIHARRARFRMARADHGGQKSEVKGKQVPRNTEEGTSKKRKRSEDSSNEHGDSSDGSSSSDSSCDSDSDDTELLTAHMRQDF